MVASVVGDTITKIMERSSSLRAFGDKTIAITDNIKRHLLTIKQVTEHNDATRTTGWLVDVTDAVNDLWDLLDDQDLLADAALLPNQSMITSFFSVCNCTPRGLVLQLKEIEKRLQHTVADLAEMLLKNRNKSINPDAKEKEKNVGREEDKEIEIVGREEDKEAVIRKILPLTEVKGAVSVAAIVGIQGMGKTTLAKLVFDDKRVKDKFKFPIWIDGIHDEFYAESIKERMIHESATKKKKELEPEEKDSTDIDKNLNLRDAMNGRRFFLVLDDLRSENREEWLKLHQILTEAASSSGGAVLVTTRNSLVANAVDPHAWRLYRLRKEDSWTLFEQVVRSELKTRDTGKKLEKKCRGVPLAILTMARMLRSREAITASEIDHLEEEFMQEMKLIYYDELPSWHLKLCFAYLSMILSDTFGSTKAETLLRLWMAEGFLGPVNLNSPFPQHPQLEDLGLDCIQEFCRISILVLEDNSILTYKMDSELMWQLSRFVATKDGFCFWMDDRDVFVKEIVRRVALSPDLDVSYGIHKSLTKNNKSLRTILFPMAHSYYWSSRIPDEVKLSWSAFHEIFCASKSLRVLNLTDLGMKMLPISIGKLKSLRYLDLSRNNMKKLPTSIGKLTRLQTLILSRCHQLRELPNEVGDLVSLRHLVMDECLQLTHMPLALKKLTNLLTLSHFMVSTSNNHKHILGFGELVHLNNLRGELEISHLERLESRRDEHAYLRNKQHLKRLTLKWNHDEDKNHHNNHDQVSLGHLEPHPDQISLQHLEPHPNLQGLSIVGYRGTKFSDWLLSLENLVTFSLYNCSMCRSIPPLDKFPKLKVLQLKRLDSLEYITDQDDGCNELRLKLLKDLSISDCPKLTSWWKGVIHTSALFHSISNLEVRNCPKLDCMPWYPKLDGKLVLEGSSMKPLLETINFASASNSMMPSDSDSGSNSNSNSLPPLCKLGWLTIRNAEEQSPLPADWLKNFFSLCFLCISENMSLLKGSKDLSSLSTVIITKSTGDDLPRNVWKCLQSLKHLEIQEVVKLKRLPSGIKHLTSLTELSILSCPELKSLGRGIGDLKCLKLLLIEDCHKLASLPKGMSQLTSLNRLIIRNCPLLLLRCQEETGDDWPKIKNIKDRRLTGTSKVYE